MKNADSMEDKESQIKKELFEAVKCRNINKVKLLLSGDFDINFKDNNGYTQLHMASHMACEKGYKDIAELLISKGVKLMSKIMKVSPHWI
jgi:ankyrin repeat protein